MNILSKVLIGVLSLGLLGACSQGGSNGSEPLFGDQQLRTSSQNQSGVDTNSSDNVTDGSVADTSDNSAGGDVPVTDGDNTSGGGIGGANYSIAGKYQAVSLTVQDCGTSTCALSKQLFKSVQTVNFEKNGALSGRAACNGYGGNYSLTARPGEGTHLLSIRGLISTMMACSLLSEEQALFEALTHAYKVSNSNSPVISIYSKVGRSLVSLELRRLAIEVPPPPEPVHNYLGEYDVVAYNSHYCPPTGFGMPCSATRKIFQSKQSLTLGKNGQLSGKAACNGYGGSYKVSLRPKEGTHLFKAGPLLSTMMACSLLAEENLLFRAIGSAYKITNSSSTTIHLFTSNGSLELRRRPVVQPRN